MELNPRFSKDQLEKIIEEAAIYMCACPAQVAVQINHLRELIRYQTKCIQEANANSVVHQAIGQAGIDAHAIMEACLDKVLTLEGWDRETLKMPEGLRQRRDELVHRNLSEG